MTNLTELKRLARGATPGPWYADHTHISSDEDIICDHISKESDREYVAAANPTTVLELISALETAREALRYSESEQRSLHAEILYHRGEMDENSVNLSLEQVRSALATLSSFWEGKEKS